MLQFLDCVWSIVLYLLRRRYWGAHFSASDCDRFRAVDIAGIWFIASTLQRIGFGDDQLR